MIKASELCALAERLDRAGYPATFGNDGVSLQVYDPVHTHQGRMLVVYAWKPRRIPATALAVDRFIAERS